MQADGEGGGLVAFVEEAKLVAVHDVLSSDVEGATRKTGGVHMVGFGLLAGGDDERNESQEAEGRVGKNTGTKEAAFLPREGVHGIVANQAFGTADLEHDFIASIDAGRASDAFHLQTFADVDAGGADVDAAVAINAGPVGWV